VTSGMQPATFPLKLNSFPEECTCNVSACVAEKRAKQSNLSTVKMEAAFSRMSANLKQCARHQFPEGIVSIGLLPVMSESRQKILRAPSAPRRVHDAAVLWLAAHAQDVNRKQTLHGLGSVALTRRGTPVKIGAAAPQGAGRQVSSRGAENASFIGS
jgi:hypothetical protein